jgi:hypothetical protein
MHELLEICSISLFLCTFSVFLWLKKPFSQRNLFTPLKTCFLFLMGRNPLLINDLRAYKSLYNCRDTFTNVMSALQIAPFLTNKANFLDDQMNVSSFITTNYEQRTMNYQIKNKPNSNPIQTQNKANTNPIRTQFKPKQTQNKPNFPPLPHESLYISPSHLTYAAPFRIMTCELTGLKIIVAGKLGAYS